MYFNFDEINCKIDRELKAIEDSFNSFMDANQVRFKKLDPEAKSPYRAYPTDAGWDLSSSEDCAVPARGSRLISTGISFEIPVGYYGRVAPRSGLSVKEGIDVGAGVVDATYRGEVKVLLRNTKDTDFIVNKGDRIAQIIFTQILTTELKEVTELSDTDRGDSGFGSSGQ